MESTKNNDYIVRSNDFVSQSLDNQTQSNNFISQSFITQSNNIDNGIDNIENESIMPISQSNNDKVQRKVYNHSKPAMLKQMDEIVLKHSENKFNTTGSYTLEEALKLYQYGYLANGQPRKQRMQKRVKHNYAVLQKEKHIRSRQFDIIGNKVLYNFGKGMPILEAREKKEAKRYFCDEYLLKPSKHADRILYWTNKGYTRKTALALISKCNVEFKKEIAETLKDEYNKDGLLNKYRDIIERNSANNDRLVIDSLKEIAKLNGYINDIGGITTNNLQMNNFVLDNNEIINKARNFIKDMSTISNVSSSVIIEDKKDKDILLIENKDIEPKKDIIDI